MSKCLARSRLELYSTWYLLLVMVLTTSCNLQFVPTAVTLSFLFFCLQKKCSHVTVMLILFCPLSYIITWHNRVGMVMFFSVWIFKWTFILSKATLCPLMASNANRDINALRSVKCVSVLKAFLSTCTRPASIEHIEEALHSHRKINTHTAWQTCLKAVDDHKCKNKLDPTHSGYGKLCFVAHVFQCLDDLLNL